MIETEKIDWIVAGLGNPGPNYEKTRHNVGWMVLDKIAEKFDKDISHRMYFNLFSLVLHDRNVLFVKPNIFMNNSGEPIKRLLDKCGTKPENLLVIYDELQFPLGRIQLKFGGSDGGHNGVTSIIEKTTTTEFARLRCGIGNDFRQGEMANYVLSEFRNNEKAEASKMIKNAADSVELVINYGITMAMNMINSGFLE